MIKKKAFFFFLVLIIVAFLFFGKSFMTGNVILSNYDSEGKLLETMNYQPKNTNVIIITIDALRADHLGIYGYERNTSPNIDQFAQDSLVFERAYVQWPRTNPSITSIFSSTYPHTNGVLRTEATSKDLIMLQEILKFNQYNTFGAVNNPVLSKKFNLDQGFDDYLVIGNEIENFADVSNPKKLTDETIMWLEDNQEGNFFAWIHYLDPHTPYNSAQGKKEHDLFVEDEYYNKEKRHAPIGDFALVGNIPTGANLNNITSLDYYVSQYDAEIHYTDEFVGKLLDYLKSDGLFENTLIVITADHGESLTDQDYLFNHGAFAYDSTAHVPLIIHFPEKIDKSRIGTPVPLIDLTPTVLDFLDIPISEEMEGNSLLSLVYENKNQNKFVFTEARELDTKRTKSLLSEFYSISIRDNENKLIRNIFLINESTGQRADFKKVIVKGDDSAPNFKYEVQEVNPLDYELFDTINDPSEKNNLLIYATAKAVEIAADLDKEITKWFDSAEKFKYSSEGVPSLSERELETIKSLGYLG